MIQDFLIELEKLKIALNACLEDPNLTEGQKRVFRRMKKAGLVLKKELKEEKK